MRKLFVLSLILVLGLGLLATGAAAEDLTAADEVTTTITTTNGIEGVVRGDSAQTAQQSGMGDEALDSIALTLGKGSFWVVLLATIVAGAAGGFVYEMLMLEGNLELPHKPDASEVKDAQYKNVKIGDRINLYDLGIWARVAVGALAGIAALFVVAPSSAFRLLATCVIAGSAGASIFDSLHERLNAMLAAEKVEQHQENAELMLAKFAEAQGAQDQAVATINEELAKLKEALGQPEPQPGQPVGAEVMPAAGVVTPESVERIEELVSSLSESRRLLDEARGIVQTGSTR